MVCFDQGEYEHSTIRTSLALKCVSVCLLSLEQQDCIRVSMDMRGFPPQKERSPCSNSSFCLKTSLMTSLLMKSPLLSMAMLACNRNSGVTSEISIPSVACHFRPSCLYSLNLQLFRFLALKIEPFKQESCIFRTINLIHYLPLLHCHSTTGPLMSKHH